MKEKDKRNALNEIRFLASIESKFIIGYKEAFYDEQMGALCIVMEFANEGDLQSKVKKAVANKLRIPECDIWRMAHQLLEGLSCLHEHNIIHRDIKPANIFFHENIAKIGDLNVAKHLTDQFTKTQTGTPYYASPEVWNEEPYNFKSDVWSLGCVLYEMAMLRPPFRADNPDALYKKIMIGEFPRLTTFYTKELDSFISKMLIQSQSRRPSVGELLNHPKILEFKFETEEEAAMNERLLKTIKFPSNLRQLNERLPAPKYIDKPVTSKVLREQKSLFKSPKSQRNIALVNLKSVLSEKKIELKSKLILEETKESNTVSKPKALCKKGSQKLIF